MSYNVFRYSEQDRKLHSSYLAFRLAPFQANEPKLPFLYKHLLFICVAQAGCLYLNQNLKASKIT